MSLLSLLRRTPSSRILRVLRIVSMIGAIAAIFWVCTYKIMDRDFWWHITAGRIMLQTHAIIRIDPFAYTRVGQPYFANYEWLAQIILSLIYKFTGSTGIILFRGIVATSTVGILLTLAKRTRFAYLLLGVWAVVITKGSWLERPQLFTFVLFATFLALAFRLLDAESVKSRIRLCIGLVATEFLWVNLHGGAAILGCAIATFLFVQAVVDPTPHMRGSERTRTLLLLGATLGAAALAFVLPPNGIGSLRYLWSLLSDQTILYIAEFRPRDWVPYIIELWPFIVFACVSLWFGRRHWIFNLLLLLMVAFLSRQAVRNEIFLVLACIATTFYQWERSETGDRIMQRLARGGVGIVLLATIVTLALGNIAYARSMEFERGDNLFGFGQFDLARGAFDFLEHAHVTGNMFNTYGIGGYLIYRGYPDRKVFMDGRNVDYGMEYLTHAYAAGVSPEEWDALTKRYDIGYAVIDYDAIRLKDRIPYSTILDRNPQWSLVYLDDWVAVYLKNTPQNQPIIDAYRYRVITATDLQFNSGFENMKDDALPPLLAELQRVRRDNPEGSKATLAIAKIDLRLGRISEATDLAKEALRIRPYSPEPYEILGAAAVSQQQWNLAADAYAHLLSSAGQSYPDINYGFIADVFEKAGRPWAAWLLRWRTHAPTPPAPPSSATGAAVAHGSGQSLPVNPARDAEAFNDKGIAQAENKQYADAEQSFQNAIKLNPSYAEAWNNLCALRLTLARYKDAIDACKRAVKEHDDYGDAHFNLALGYYRSGAKELALTEATRAGQLGRRKESDELLLLIRQMHL